MAIQDPVDYGTDIALNRDSFRYVSGIENLVLQLERRLSTKKGSIRWAPDEGIDVRECADKYLSPNDVTDLSFRIQKELERDERVVLVKVLFKGVKLVGQLHLVTTENQEFDLELTITKEKVELKVT